MNCDLKRELAGCLPTLPAVYTLVSASFAFSHSARGP